MAFGISATGLFLGGAAITGGLIAANGSKSAANAQAASADKAADLNWQQYQQTREDQAPWRAAGQTALSSLVSGLQDGGQYVKPFSMADFQEDPGYQFRVDQGNKAITNSAAARGASYSGATLKALQRFAQNTASDEYSAAYNRYNTDNTNSFNRLASVAGLGQTATNQTAAAGSSAAAATGQAIQDAGTARASGYVGTGNAVSSALGSLGNYAQLSSLLGSRSSGYSSGLSSDAYSTPEGSIANVLY